MADEILFVQLQRQDRRGDHFIAWHAEHACAAAICSHIVADMSHSSAQQSEVDSNFEQSTLNENVERKTLAISPIVHDLPCYSRRSVPREGLIQILVHIVMQMQKDRNTRVHNLLLNYGS